MICKRCWHYHAEDDVCASLPQQLDALMKEIERYFGICCYCGLTISIDSHYTTSTTSTQDGRVAHGSGECARLSGLDAANAALKVRLKALEAEIAELNSLLAVEQNRAAKMREALNEMLGIYGCAVGELAGEDSPLSGSGILEMKAAFHERAKRCNAIYDDTAPRPAGR